LTWHDDVYEHMVGVVEGEVDITSSAGSGQASADAVAIVPPGESAIVARTLAKVFRVFAPAPEQLKDVCLNWGSYDTPRHNVAPFELWPEPVDGYKLRIYQYADMPQDA